MDINRENYESWFLDYVEGSLSAGQISQVHEFIAQHPEFGAELKSWQATLIKPDLQLVYPDKERLKRRQRIIALPWWGTVSAIAALLALFLILFPLNNQNRENSALVLEQMEQLEQSEDAVQRANSSAVGGIDEAASSESLNLHAPGDALTLASVDADNEQGITKRPDRSAPAALPHIQVATRSVPEPKDASAQDESAQQRDTRTAAAPQQRELIKASAGEQKSALNETPQSAIAQKEEAPSLSKQMDKSPLAQAPDQPVQDQLQNPTLLQEPSNSMPIADAEPLLPQAKELIEPNAESGMRRRTSINEAPGAALVQVIGNVLPEDIAQVMSLTQNAGTEFGTLMAGIMSGERNLLGRNRDETESGEARVVQFSVGPIKVYHRKSSKRETPPKQS